MKLSRYTVSVDRGHDLTTLFNTYRQSFAHIPTTTWNALCHTESIERADVDLPADAWTGLLETGFLVAEDLDELGNVLSAQRVARSDTGRLELTIAPTMSCNLRCGYCTEMHKRPTSMSQQDEDQIVQFVRSRLDGVRELQVCWFGGEPLVRPAPIISLSKKLIGLCSFRGIAYRASVITNGTLMTDELARKLRGLQVRTARITIDGPRDIHDLMRPTTTGRGSFDDVLQGVDIARRHFDTSIGINIGKPNVRRAHELLEELARRGFFDVTVFLSRIFDPAVGDDGPDAPRGRSVSLSVEDFAKHEVRLLRIARGLGLRVSGFGDESTPLPCSAVKENHFVLEPGGMVKRCYTEVTDDSKATGSIQLGELKLSQSDKRWLDHDLVDDGCLSCAYLPMCHGGCPKFRMNGVDKERDICTPRKFNLIDLVRDEL